MTDAVTLDDLNEDELFRLLKENPDQDEFSEQDLRDVRGSA